MDHVHVHLGQRSKYCKIKIIHRCGGIVNDVKSETLTNKKFISNRVVYVIMLMNIMQIVKGINFSGKWLLWQ